MLYITAADNNFRKCHTFRHLRFSKVTEPTLFIGNLAAVRRQAFDPVRGFARPALDARAKDPTDTRNQPVRSGKSPLFTVSRSTGMMTSPCVMPSLRQASANIAASYLRNGQFRVVCTAVLLLPQVF
jgi:hypothetical protein